MELIIAAIAIFLVIGILLVSFFYLLASPNKDKNLSRRLQAIQRPLDDTSSEVSELELLRQKTLSKLPALDRFLAQLPIAVKLNLFVQQAGMEIHVARLIALMFLIYATVFLGSMLVRLPLVLSILLAAAFAIIPYAVIAFKRYKRFSKFEEQFPEAIDLLARAVRAGHAFTTGLELIGKEMPEPVAGEFRLTYEQQNLGLPLRDTFHNLLYRVPLSDVHVFVTALLIQRESGGNLAEILENLARVIRERFKLFKQVKVYTAQGRISLYILTAVPPIFGVLLFFLNRDYISLLFTHPLGIKMLAAGVILQIVGFLVIRKIIEPKP